MLRPHRHHRTGHSGARITTPAPTSLIATADGSLIGAGPDVVVRIGRRQQGLPDHRPASPTDSGGTDRRRQGSPAGTVSGSVVVFGKDLSRERTISGFVRVDGSTVSPAGVGLDYEQVVVLDPGAIVSDPDQHR